MQKLKMAVMEKNNLIWKPEISFT